MDWDTLRLFFAVATLGITGIVWAVRLEGRVTAHEKECAERQKRIDERHEMMQHTLDAIHTKLDRLMERA